jgi:Domain of unknown function (DUF4265)
MSQSDKPTAKVLFRVPEEDGAATVETLWAYDLGNDLYKIDNCPFYAYDVSAEDIVYAPIDPDEERPTFKKVVTKSGNKTLRVIFNPPVEPGNSSDKILQGAVQLGASYEGANPGYIAINIPPSLELAIVADYLIDCKATWEHADPSYEQLYPNDT